MAKTSLEKAIRIGELLAQQKARLKHGEWLPWIESNLEFSDQTARRYMMLWNRRDEIQHCVEFELTEAYRLLSQPAEEPPSAPPGVEEDEKGKTLSEPEQIRHNA